MKNLDKTQVYDLRGITEEQAKELYELLCCYNEGWSNGNYRWIRESFSLEFARPFWTLSSSKPTTHISTLFEPTYEEQLQEAKKKLEHYKKEVERLEDESKPKINDVCKFWNDVEGDFFIGILTGADDSHFPYQVGAGGWFKH